MIEPEHDIRAFANFRALNSEADIGERDQLFRNMAQLFSFVSDRCDDEQVAQYDEILTQLAELVETQARADVAQLLAPLSRAPGAVVVKLANDTIEVARPLLQFSNVLSDDDLIEIVAGQTEAHRVAVAGRGKLAERVGSAIVTHGGSASVTRLVRNATADLGEMTLARLVDRAANDEAIASDLRGREGVDWHGIRDKISSASSAVLESLVAQEKRPDAKTMGQVNATVYNRIRNKAGFNTQEWEIAWSQVQALNDRRRLDSKALERFARFGYGHHVAGALAMMLKIEPIVLIKWLAAQDYVAVTVAGRALGLDPDLFESIMGALPWRDLPQTADKQQVRARFEALAEGEAHDIFQLWRAHAFHKRGVENAPRAGVA